MLAKILAGLLVVFLALPAWAVVTEPTAQIQTEFTPKSKDELKTIQAILRPIFPTFPFLPDILPQIIDTESEQEEQVDEDLGQQEQELEEEQDPEPGSQEEYEQLIAEGEALIEEIEALSEENQGQADALALRAIEVERIKYLTKLLDDLKDRYGQLGKVNQETLDAIREASGRHVAWIQEFRALIRQWRPDWANVVDLETYKLAYSRVAAFKRDTPRDQNVLHKESEVRQLLTERSKSIQEIIGRLAYLTSNEKIESIFQEKGALALLEKSRNIKNGLFEMLAQVDRPIILMTIQQQIRRKLLVDVPRKWHRNLASVMQRIIQENAIELTDQYLRSVNDPVLYYDAKYKILQSGAKISDLLFTDYCPRLALRQLKIHQVLIQDIESNLPTLPVTEPIRDKIRIEVNGGWNVHATYKNVLDSLTEDDKRFMFEYRVSRVDNVLSNPPENGFSQACSLQGQSLLEREYQEGVSTHDHEKEYKEFMEKCTAN